MIDQPSMTDPVLKRCYELFGPATVFIPLGCGHFRLAPKISEIIERILADAEKNNRRDRTIDDLKYRLETFGRDFGELRVMAKFKLHGLVDRDVFH